MACVVVVSAWRQRALTLFETMLAMIIVAVGITAAVELMTTATAHNAAAARLSISLGLASNIQELMTTAWYTDPRSPGHWGLESGEQLNSNNASLDLDDFDGAAFGLNAPTPSSPVDAGWQAVANQAALPQLARFTQRITVKKVKKNDLSTELASNAADEGVRKVMVDVSFQPTAALPDKVLYRLVFLRFKER